MNMPMSSLLPSRRRLRVSLNLVESLKVRMLGAKVLLILLLVLACQAQEKCKQLNEESKANLQSFLLLQHDLAESPTIVEVDALRIGRVCTVRIMAFGRKKPIYGGRLRHTLRRRRVSLPKRSLMYSKVRCNKNKFAALHFVVCF